MTAMLDFSRLPQDSRRPCLKSRRPRWRAGRWLALLPCGLALAGCSLLDDPQPAPLDLDLQPTAISRAERDDLALRVAERVARPDRYGEGELFLEIERLMPAWQAEQRRGRAEPVEARLTQEVVAHFDMLTTALRTASHERRVVAAWALGFSRVPLNSAGVRSPHPLAVQALLTAMTDADDEVMRNILVGLWRIGDPQTPVEPIIEVLRLHHDATARSNAALVLSAVLTRASISRAEAALMQAMQDADPKVRLHATNVAVKFPRPTFTEILIERLPDEPMPLVRARMAEALGRTNDRSAARVLLPLLDRGDALEHGLARQSLVMLFGVDRGPRSDDWRDLVSTLPALR